MSTIMQTIMESVFEEFGKRNIAHRQAELQVDVQKLYLDALRIPNRRTSLDFYQLAAFYKTISVGQDEVVKEKYFERWVLSMAAEAAYYALKGKISGVLGMSRFRLKEVGHGVGYARTVGTRSVRAFAVHRCQLIREGLTEGMLEKIHPWLYIIGKGVGIKRKCVKECFPGCTKRYYNCGHGPPMMKVFSRERGW